jgi:hypothetical protein
VLLAVLLAGLLHSVMAADESGYSFIIDPASYPAENNSSSSFSAGTAIETGAMYETGTSSSTVDSCFRNSGVSVGSALNAKKWRAITITFR